MVAFIAPNGILQILYVPIPTPYQATIYLFYKSSTSLSRPLPGYRLFILQILNVPIPTPYQAIINYLFILQKLLLANTGCLCHQIMDISGTTVLAKDNLKNRKNNYIYSATYGNVSSGKCDYAGPGPKSVKPFPCSTQLSL